MGNGRTTTPTFTAERRIMAGDGAVFLDAKLDLLGRMYNNAVRHYRRLLTALRKDAWYQECLQAWKTSKDENERTKLSKEIFRIALWCGLSKNAIEAYMGAGKVQSCTNGINIDLVQKTASELYQSVKKALFADTEIHFRKKGHTNSMSGKKATTGIIYNDKNGTVKIMGKIFPLAKIREKDVWLMEALTHRVKYCRVVRRPYGKTYRYFLQIILEGLSPWKVKPGKGKCGIDQGPSVLAWSTDTAVHFDTLAVNERAYSKEVCRWQRVYERRRRMANPQCYHPDGRIIKGSKFTVHTKGMLEALMRLKSAALKKSAYIRQSHGHLTNLMVQECEVINIEPMNWKALAHRSKKDAERQAKASAVKTKGKKTRMVHKFKRKKRFGKSILRHAPGLLSVLIKQKAQRYKLLYREIDTAAFKASQYNHVDGTYNSPDLSERTKIVGGHRVQRDCYSSWITKHAEDETHPSIQECNKDFKNFLRLQGKTVNRILHEGDVTKTFGLRDFIKQDA